MLCNIARFRLRAHTLRVATESWQIHIRHCDKRDLHDVQDEKVVFCALAAGSIRRRRLMTERL